MITREELDAVGGLVVAVIGAIGGLLAGKYVPFFRRGESGGGNAAEGGPMPVRVANDPLVVARAERYVTREEHGKLEGRIDRLESDVRAELEQRDVRWHQKLDRIQGQNAEILRAIGRLEGKTLSRD